MLTEQEKGIVKETVPVLQEEEQRSLLIFTIECFNNIQS